jgi:Co/Zn/Cd efflux system component
MIVLLIGAESMLRLANPIPINFAQAIAVAAVGLIVNLVSARLLKDDHAHHHHQHSNHRHDSKEHADAGSDQHDNNLRTAYVHVLADALTSILAIVALLTSKLANQTGLFWTSVRSVGAGRACEDGASAGCLIVVAAFVTGLYDQVVGHRRRLDPA